MKNSTLENRNTQSTCLHCQRSDRVYWRQISRPFITLELDDIRKYQRQALLKSPYGTIPLYRRQAWAAANLFHGYPLHLLRYMQSSLRMQIHHLLGYDPSDICNGNMKKKISKKTMNQIFHISQDISVVGSNNQLYRGRVVSCKTTPLKTVKEKQLNRKAKVDENYEIHKISIDQLDETKKDVTKELLFKYLDWQTKDNEQDLPNELYEELFHQRKSITDEEQSCACKSESNLHEQTINEKVNSMHTETNTSYDDQCICSACSCNCEKHVENESICICSQCSCHCLKDIQHVEDPLHIHDENVSFERSDFYSSDNFKMLNGEELNLMPTKEFNTSKQNQENKIQIYDYFTNRFDSWIQNLYIVQDTQHQTSSPSRVNNRSTSNDICYSSISAPATLHANRICNALELDDPMLFRQRILDLHRQRQ